MPFQLLVTGGPSLGRTINLRAGKQLVIGRGDDCDLQLLDASISRRHCRIVVEHGHAKMEDLNSKWGTFLNGQKIDVCPLQLNDTVTLGQSELRFQVSPEAATLEHPASQTPGSRRSTQREQPRRKKNQKSNRAGIQSPQSDPRSGRQSVSLDSHHSQTPKPRSRHRESRDRSSRRSIRETSQRPRNRTQFAAIGAIATGLIVVVAIAWGFLGSSQSDEDPKTIADASQTAKSDRSNAATVAPPKPPIHQSSSKNKPPRQNTQPVAKKTPPRKTNAPKVAPRPTKRPPLKIAKAKTPRPKPNPRPKPRPKPATKIEVKPLDLAKLTKMATPCLVRVEINDPQDLEGGTGFVVDSNGLIATSYHLIQNAKAASVVFADGMRFPVLGARFASPKQDLAFIKINPAGRELKPLRPTPYGNSMNIPVASFALGPGDDIQAQAGKTVSLPKIKELNAKGVSFTRGKWVQTSIPLSAGGRGGPILDKLGNLVGINILPFPDDPKTALANSHLGVQHGLSNLSPKLVSLDKLRQDKRLAEFGLNVFFMTEDAQVTIPATIKREIRDRMRKGSKPLKVYAQKSGPRFADQINTWRRGLYEGYQTNGSRDPAWDSYAEKLLLPQTLSKVETKTILDGVFSSKCNDPAILMTCASLMPPSARTINTAKRAAKLLESSAYPPRNRYPLWQLYVDIARSHEGATDLFSIALKKVDDDFIKALCRPGLTAYERRMLFYHFEFFYPGGMPRLRREGPNQVLAGMEMDPWLRDMVLGSYHTNIGWTARGTGFANTVSDQQWEIFRTHIEKARLHFLKAWQRHRDSPEAATHLVALTMANQGIAGENERFWFEQAIAAQFDYQSAYGKYMYSIEPRWGGSHRLLLEFGNECLDTGRFDTMVPYQFHQVVVAIAQDPTVPPRSLILAPDIIDTYRRLTDGYREAKSEILTPTYLDSLLMCALANGDEAAKEEARKRLKELGDNLDHKAIKAFGITYASVINRLNR